MTSEASWELVIGGEINKTSSSHEEREQNVIKTELPKTDAEIPRYICFVCLSPVSYIESNTEIIDCTRVQNDESNSVIQLLLKALKFPPSLALQNMCDNLKNSPLACCHHPCYNNLLEAEHLYSQLDAIEQRLEIMKNELKLSILSNFKKERIQQEKGIVNSTCEDKAVVDSLQSLRGLFIQCWSECKVELSKLKASQIPLNDSQSLNNRNLNNSSSSLSSSADNTLVKSKRIRKKSSKVIEAERDAFLTHSKRKNSVKLEENRTWNDNDDGDTIFDNDFDDSASVNNDSLYNVEENNDSENKQDIKRKLKAKRKKVVKPNSSSARQKEKQCDGNKMPKIKRNSSQTVTSHTTDINQETSINVEEPTVKRPKKFGGSRIGVVQSCTICEKTFQTRAALKTHVANIHEKTFKYVCDECGTGFQVLSMLKRHKMYVHTNVKAFECEICHMKFKRSHQLFYHKRRHTGELPFICDICGKGYIQAERLRMHLEIHTGEKKYPCPIPGCKKFFAVKQYVTNHIHDTHEGRRRNRTTKQPTSNSDQIKDESNKSPDSMIKYTNANKKLKFTGSSGRISAGQTYHLQSLDPVESGHNVQQTIKISTHSEEILIDEIQVGEVIVPAYSHHPDSGFSEGEIVVFQIPKS